MENKRIDLQITYSCGYSGECKWNRKCNECPYSKVLQIREKIKSHTKTDKFKLNFFRIVNYFGS